MITQTDITIPKAHGEVIWLRILYAIVVFFVIVAVYNLCNGIAPILSMFWLGFITLNVLQNCKSEGGLGKFLANRVGDVAGRRFMNVSVCNEVRFGYELLGRRVVQQSVLIEKIESIELAPGQATGMAGRDMDDWNVLLWFDHDDPIKSQKRQRLRKPNQEVLVIGPSRRKEVTEALGHVIIACLRGAGATLVQGEKDTCFVRSKADAKQ